MRVLKSGIEMDSKQMQKVKGGICACACDIGYDAENNSELSVNGGLCMCGCVGWPGMARNTEGNIASKYIPLP
ncbi:MAG: hypothetical protein GY950_27590 [bacterium]|nr:hypothetical protein [bacterium]